MEINDELIDNLAHLAKLKYENEGKEAIKQDLKKITAFFDKINEVDTEHVQPLVYINEEVNVVRIDQVVKLNTRAEGLKNAAIKNEQYLQVPKVIQK